MKIHAIKYCLTLLLLLGVTFSLKFGVSVGTHAYAYDDWNDYDDYEYDDYWDDYNGWDYYYYYDDDNDYWDDDEPFDINDYLDYLYDNGFDGEVNQYDDDGWSVYDPSDGWIHVSDPEEPGGTYYGGMLDEVTVIGHRPDDDDDNTPPPPEDDTPLLPEDDDPPCSDPCDCWGDCGGDDNVEPNVPPATLPPVRAPFTAQQYKNTGGYSATCDCMCVTQKIMQTILGNNANIGSNATKIQLYLENSNGLLYKVGDAGNVFNVLNSHIDNGRPIIAGVDHTSKQGINEGATDHFIVIIGRGYDTSIGQYYYNYVETARGPNNGVSANSDSNRLYYDSSIGTFVDTNTYIVDREYTLTQIRPNQ
jgi:hypothetical protein